MHAPSASLANRLISRLKSTLLYKKAVQFYYRHFASNETGEALVDKDMLLWAYLQGGVFITFGCFGAYLFQMYYENVPFKYLWNTANSYFNLNSASFVLTDGTVADSDMQETLLAGAQSAYYIGIVLGQIFTLFLVKKKYGMPWGRKMIQNKMTFLAIFIAALIAGVLIYVPWFHTFIPTASVYPVPYLMPLAAGILLFIWEIVRRSMHMRGYFGGVPKKTDIIGLVRTSSTIVSMSSKRSIIR